MKSKFLGFSLVLLVAGAAFAQDWPQWGQNAQHNTQSSVFGQNLNRNIVNIVYDPLVPAMQAQNSGELLAHYQAPLVDGNDTYMMFKSGTFSETDNSTQTWGETKYSWSGGTLVQQWQFTSDWKAAGSQLDFWEPVFHPALANGSLYVPGGGGTIWRVNKLTDTGIRINPFNNVSSSRFECGPLTVDAQGRVLYNVVQLKAGTKDWYADDIIDAFLIRVSPDNSIEQVSYSTLTVGAPLGSDLCVNAFHTNPDFTIVDGPWPPSPTAQPSMVPCGTQRPGMNSSLTVAPDGTIYTATRGHLLSRETWLVAINPDLTQKWISTMRERMNDGCGVPVSQGGSLPPNGAPGGCRAGANIGVDPATNRKPGGRIVDDMSSEVVVAPDGTLWFGAFTRYNYDQGHIMKFGADGSFLGSYRFGWDETPGVVQHGATYSIVIKDNQYGGVGSYCFDDRFCPPDRDTVSPDYPEAYFITQMNKNLNIEWRFQNTNTLSCTRDANGNVTCVSDHPKGFEWCVNGFVVDAAGVVYANSEDGNLYAINQGGTLKQNIFQQLALGAAYTPTSIGNDGKIYSQNAGHLFVAGN